MNIVFDSAIWQNVEKTSMPDVKTVFAPVDSIRLWLRDETSGSTHGHAAVHDFYCLYLCLEGRGCIEVDGVPHFLETNEALGAILWQYIPKYCPGLQSLSWKHDT